MPNTRIAKWKKFLKSRKKGRKHAKRLPKPFTHDASKISYTTTAICEVLCSNATNVEVPIRTNMMMNYPGSFIGDNSTSFTQATAMSSPTKLNRMMQLFDMYKVLRVAVRWVPTQNVNSDALVGLGSKNFTNTLYIVYDMDDYGGNTELQFQNLGGIPRSVFQPQIKSYKNYKAPLMNCSNYANVQTAGFVTNASTNNNPLVQNQFGSIKTFVDGVSANGGGGVVIAGHFWVEYTIRFYGVQAAQA